MNDQESLLKIRFDGEAVGPGGNPGIQFPGGNPIREKQDMDG